MITGFTPQTVQWLIAAFMLLTLSEIAAYMRREIIQTDAPYLKWIRFGFLNIAFVSFTGALIMCINETKAAMGGGAV